MAYSLIGILALITVAIVNYDIFFARHSKEEAHLILSYRIFLSSLVVFLAADIAWGFFDEAKMQLATSITTSIYFLAMSATVLAWTHFNVRYLQEKGLMAKIILLVGWALFLAGVIILIINFFQPVLFSFDGVSYVPGIGRHLFLGLQILMYLLTSTHALLHMRRSRGVALARYTAIVAFGLALSLSIALQLWFPLQPFYAIGCSVGTTIIRAFVLTSENNEFRQAIREGESRETQAKEELGFAKKLAYSDPLTGAKSKHAYVEREENVDLLIRNGEMEDFAVVVFDLNDLKLTNDTKGHDAGDALLIASANLIHQFFPAADFYRFGGDEFVLLLMGDSYRDRHELLAKFDAKVLENIGTEQPVVSTGMADFYRNDDHTLGAVFFRADQAMYTHKRKLKQTSNPKSGIRTSFYDMFYHNKNCSLVEMLNNSSCDDILEVNLKRNDYRLFFHAGNKYIDPPECSSFDDLYHYCCENLVHPDDLEDYQRLISPDRFFQRIAKARIPNFDFAHLRFKTRDGGYRYVEQCVIAGEENEIAPDTFRIYVIDINNLKVRMEGKQISVEGGYESEYNTLTGLLNEEPFFRKAQELVTSQPKTQWSLVCIDIEHFRFFDEWYGREKGDELLANIGKTLAEEEKRLGGLAGYFAYDDFALLCPSDSQDFNALYEKIRTLVVSFGLSVGFLPALGIANLGKGARVVDAFDQANIALGYAKKDLRHRVSIYDPRFSAKEENDYRVLSEFVDGMKNDEFTFYLQPQCFISSGKIAGAEALARWVKKTGRIISPAEYIPVLEKYGFIMDLDQVLWEKIVKWLRSMLDQGINPVPISVNVSRADILTLDIAKIFHDLAEKYDVPHNLLKIEITESAYIETTTQITELVKALRADKFMVLMDDFGSGYSSLNMLNALEMDAIKLDGDFLRLSGSAYERGIRIIESVVNMTKNLAIPIIVEGVETESQSTFLQSLGCRYAQGFYFYRPMPVNQFEEMLHNEKKLDRRGIVAKANEQFRMREFLDKNVYSDSMLNNIIGAVAFYAFHEDTGDVDIVRFNEQFYEAVGIAEFHERLDAMQRYMPKEDVPVFHAALIKAREDHLAGASADLRFLKPDGSVCFFHIHFYHIGKKENADLFYGSAANVSDYMVLRDEANLVSKYSSDSFIFISRRAGKWVYSVASHGLSNLLGCTPEELEKDLNDGSFAKRVSRKDNLQEFMRKADEFAEKKEDFEREFHLRGKRGKSVDVLLRFTYVGDQSDNVLYVLRASEVEKLAD